MILLSFGTVPRLRVRGRLSIPTLRTRRVNASEIYSNNRYQLTWITHFQQRKICQNTTNIFFDLRLVKSTLLDHLSISCRFFVIKPRLVRPRMHYVLVLYPYLSSDTVLLVTVHTFTFYYQLSRNHIACIWKGKSNTFDV